jgi:hypothetical protein
MGHMALPFLFRYRVHALMAFDLKENGGARLGRRTTTWRHLNRTLVAAPRVIGFDKVYARASGAYLYDMDDPRSTSPSSVVPAVFKYRA